MKTARLPSILILLAGLLAFLTAPATASLPQGPWLDLLEIRADQAMEAHNYAEVLRVADLYRQAGAEPGFKLQAQEIVARAAARRTSRVGRWRSMDRAATARGVPTSDRKTP